MPDASFIQTNFLGGEWSPFAQGRADMEAYRTGMNVCQNVVILEVGAATRRPGTNVAATTRGGVNAVLRAFHFSEALPFNAEFTAGHLRLFDGISLLLQNIVPVAGISAANPAVAATTRPHGYTTGDQVQFEATFNTIGSSPSGLKLLFNRQFVATVVDSTHFSLSDPVTGATIDGSQINASGWSLQVGRVVDFATSYADAELQAVRLVQNEEHALILHANHPPEALTNTIVPTQSQLAVFSFAQATFTDGPYLDPPTDGSTLTPTGTSGTITLTASSAASINGGTGFVSTDVGRLMRLFSQPAAWASGTNYAKGANVTYANVQWQAIQANTGIQPDTDPGINWVINPTGASWTWGTIASVISTTQVTLTLAAADPLGVLAGGSLQYSTAMTVWQMGLYSVTTGWPAVGCFHEGRFWLGGVTPNRLDSTQANNPESDPYNFGPTLLDGSVPDECGISVTFEGEDRNTIFWTLPDHQGIIGGTQGGEWLIQASQLNEPLTPTSIQAHKVTKYGCSNIEPRSTGLSHVFVHRYQLQLYEYITDVFSGKFIGTNIGRKAKHMISPGIAEIAYQAEKAPIVWSRTTDGHLLGCTYKRESPFSTQPASFMGWHQHPLGSGRKVTSIQGGPSPDGATDTLAMVTLDGNTGIHFVELLSPIPEETDTLFDAWFVDGAAVPAAAEISGSNLILYGLQYIAGDVVSAWIAGTDAGDHTVQSDGSLTVPLPANLLTAAYLASLTGTFANLNLAIQVTPPTKGFFSPNGSLLDYTFNTNYNAHLSTNVQRLAVDWDTQVAYFMAATNLHKYVEAMNIGTRASISTTQADTIDAASTVALGYDHNLYFGTSTASTLICRWNTNTLATDQVYNDGLSLMAPGYCVAIQLGSLNFVLATGLNAGTGGTSAAPWYIIDMANQQWVAGSGTGGGGSAPGFSETYTGIAPGNAFPLRGPPGRAYVLAINQAQNVIGVYEAAVESSTVAGIGRIGGITPSQIHAGWTTFSLSEAIVFDETDGNIIFGTIGSDATTRLVKISAANATVLWSILVSGVPGDFRTSRVRNGRFTLLGAGSNPYDMYQVDTIAGTAVHTTQTVLAETSYSTDDVYGQVIANINDIGANQWATFGPAPGGGPGAITPAVSYNSPAVIGFTYTSKGQVLRPVTAQEAGAANGPAQGKTRRVFRAAPLFANTQGVSMGTYFSKLHACAFKSPGGTVALTNQQLYSGVYRDTVDDDYSFNGMWCWQTSRPYPTTVVSVECFLHTQDL